MIMADKTEEKLVAGSLERESSPESGPDSGLSGYRSIGFDEKATKRLLRKIDYALIPFLALLYLLSFLDRTNIGNARIAGPPSLETSLGMAGLDYNVALGIFFPFYIAIEIPSNLMMKRTRPSLWIPTIMVAWSITCICQGLVSNYAGLLVVRAALGIAEGGLFPGVTYYITMWYRRHECGFRMALFFSAATAAGAFGGLLARGINAINNRGGKPSWAWIFIIEGMITFIIAISAYFLMHDYPDTARFLSTDEKTEVHRRLQADRRFLADEYHPQYLIQALTDWKIWVHMFITIGVFTPLYSISLFLPTIIKELGYTDNNAQLMTVPPYVVACFFCIGANYLADKQGTRGIYMIIFNLIAITGFTMLIASSNSTVKYIGCFFAASGIYPNVPQGVAWNGNNIGGSLKRGVGIAMHVGFGNLGGLIAAFLFQSYQAPRYFQGYGVLIAMLSLSTLLCIVLTLYLRGENARRDRELKAPADYSEAEMMAEREKGDYAGFFRYTV